MSDAAASPLPHAAVPVREPAFGLDDERDILVTPRWSREATGRYLAHAVARAPANLRAHLQRIALWSRAGDGAETFGALLDLFIALGTAGRPLRARALKSAARACNHEQRAFLAHALGSGISALQPHPPAPTSVLTGGVTGTLDAVVRNEAAVGAPHGDALQEARDYLNEGNLEAARDLLEAGLLRAPDRKDLADELLTIYRHAREPARIAAMRLRLGDNLVDRAAWDACERAIAAAGGASA